jgi:hypothetical protein
MLMAKAPGKIEEYFDNFLAEVCKQDDFNQEFCTCVKIMFVTNIYVAPFYRTRHCGVNFKAKPRPCSF